MKAGLSVGELLKESKSKSWQSVSRKTEAPPDIKEDSHHFVWFSAYLTSSHGAKTSPLSWVNSAPKDGASGSSDIADILDKEQDHQ